eukprot:15469840-Alexandrium_andersonii.AAC.1
MRSCPSAVVHVAETDASPGSGDTNHTKTLDDTKSAAQESSWRVSTLEERPHGDSSHGAWSLRGASTNTNIRISASADTT